MIDKEPIVPKLIEEYVLYYCIKSEVDMKHDMGEKLEPDKLDELLCDVCSSKNGIWFKDEKDICLSIKKNKKLFEKDEYKEVLNGLYKRWDENPFRTRISKEDRQILYDFFKENFDDYGYLIYEKDDDFYS